MRFIFDMLKSRVISEISVKSSVKHDFRISRDSCIPWNLPNYSFTQTQIVKQLCESLISCLFVTYISIYKLRLFKFSKPVTFRTGLIQSTFKSSFKVFFYNFFQQAFFFSGHIPEVPLGIRITFHELHHRFFFQKFFKNF